MSTWKASRCIPAAIASASLALAGVAAAQETPTALKGGARDNRDNAAIDRELSGPIDVAELSAISAGQGVVVEALSNQQLTASNSGSVDANQVVNGNVEFSAGTYSGIGNFVVNTGNNNNLQGVISVNIATLGEP